MKKDHALKVYKTRDFQIGGQNVCVYIKRVKESAGAKFVYAYRVVFLCRAQHIARNVSTRARYDACLFGSH
jgi:hypothetical protein